MTMGSDTTRSTTARTGSRRQSARRSSAPRASASEHFWTRRTQPRGCVFDVPDMDAFQALMQSQEAADAMAHDGVRADTLVVLVEA